MPWPSNWNTPPASPFASISYVSTSSSGSRSRSTSIPSPCKNPSARCRIVSVVSPRKSNFTNPACSTCFIEYCVTRKSERGSRYSGTSSISGRSPITTPAACVLAWRYRPSSLQRDLQQSAQCLRPHRASCRSRGSPAIACCKFTGLAGLFGISSATLFTWPNGSPSTRPTSRTAARACNLPKVMICATRSAPYSLAHVVDHAVAAFLAEVDVEVRHRHAFRVEESLEQQIEAQRVQIGDGQRPGGDRSGTRTAAGTDGNAFRLRPLDEVGDDQEVAGETHRSR